MQRITMPFLSTHAAAYNTSNVRRHLIQRSTRRLFRADPFKKMDRSHRCRMTSRRVSPCYIFNQLS